MRILHSWRWIGPMLWTLVLLLACRPDDRGANTAGEDSRQAISRLAPREIQEAQRNLREWFECEECDDGQLDAVVALGSVAVPSLAAALRSGPSPERRATVKRHLTTGYADLVAYADRYPVASPETTEAQYIQRYADNFVALYKVRAAIALGAIGGSAARDTLIAFNQLVRSDTTVARYDVRRSIGAALETAMSGP